MGDPRPILQIGFVEERHLPRLDGGLRPRQVTHDVAYQVISLLVGQHVAVKVARLHEVIVGMGIRLAGGYPGPPKLLGQ
jgi:hypothetical protein